MPHATDDNTSTPLTNGDKPSMSSKFISHVTSYPVVSDGINNFKSHPYGRKSIDLADSAYQRFGKPVEPYLETPLSYAKPYAEKADALADSGLEHVDARFPIIKEDTNKVIETGKSYVFYPLKMALDGKDYVFSTWNDEYEKTARHNSRGPGISTSAMALISTELKIASDFFQAVADFLGPKYDESKKKGSDYVRSAQDTASSYAKRASDALSNAQKDGSAKAEEVKDEAIKTKDQATSEASKTKDQLTQDASKAKDQATSEASKTKDQAKQKAGEAKDEVKQKTSK